MVQVRATVSRIIQRCELAEYRQTTTSFPWQTVGPNWKVFEKVRMSQLGLTLRPVPASRVANRNPDASGREDDLGRWQPDWVISSEVHKKLAIVDLCRPADVHPDQLLVAGDSKQRRYTVVVEALEYYTE